MENTVNQDPEMGKERHTLSMGGRKTMPPSLPSSNEYLVEFDSDDPTHPLNWGLAAKLYISTIACLGTFTASFTSAIFAPGTTAASKHFKVSSEIGKLGTALYVLGFAFGPLIWAPASELIGRRWPLTIGMLGGSIFIIASAVSKDIQTLIICRFFAGVFGASQLAVVPALLSDIWNDVHRGVAITLYSLAVFGGPFTAPFVGGFIAESSLGWRWTLYVPAILGFASGLLFLCSLRETYPPVLLVSKAANLRRQTGNWAIHAKQEELEVDLPELVGKYFTRPLKMLLTEPIILLISLYMSFIYGIVYALLVAYPYVFESVYGMSSGVAGLGFISLLIGQLLACALIIFQDHIDAQRAATQGKSMAPERRLLPVTIGAPVFTIGIFWVGWTGFTSTIHWMAPMAAGVLIGFGTLCIFLPCFNYLFDCYLPLAASTVAANIILRSSVAAAFPLFSQQMFANLGVRWASTLLGCLAAAMIPIPFVFRAYGAKLRAKSQAMLWGYECYYGASRRSKHSEQPTTPAPANISRVPPARIENIIPDTPQGVARSLFANSGATFVRNMALKVDPANAPRWNLFGWNVGARQLSSGVVPPAAGLSIVDIISAGDMTQLAEIYFRKVDPCYGFIDKDTFFERLEYRSNGGASNIFDTVLAGVGALGLLFSERTAKVSELLLIECAKSMLENHDAWSAPSVDLVTGWLLRVIYMRMTASPHATWLASSTLLHLIEAAGLHREAPDLPLANSTCDPDTRRRILGVAQHQNMWPSYDLGLSRVNLKIDVPILPLSPRPGDSTAELLDLLPISASLDPEQPHDDNDLQWSLLQTLEKTHTQRPTILAQTNLALCILRRLQLRNINTSPTIADRVLALTQRALHAARNMLADCCPWHHLANVPFHIITILLEMDTCASLAQLPDAMQTVKMVASTYNTATMREAHSTARLLVFLYQQRRYHDAKLLGNVLDSDSELESGSGPLPVPTTGASVEEMALLEGLVADIPSLQGFDFDQFLDMDLLRLGMGVDGVGTSFAGS
ncbi:bicyclomycin resistance protein [Aspergillus crustosus]